MPTRLLLINFRKKDAEQLVGLNIEIDRGYMSNVEGVAHYNLQKSAEVVRCYLPHPPYEYNIIVANLNNDGELHNEFHNKAKLTSESHVLEFLKFWNETGVTIVFLGDYNYKNLINLGLPQLSLKKVDTIDITCNYVLGGESNFKKLFKEMSKEVIMPTKNYLSMDNQNSFENKAFRTIYQNRGGYILAAYLNGKPSYDDTDAPDFIILPQFKNNMLMLEKILKELSQIYKKLIPEMYEANWAESDKYYPKEVDSYDDAITDVINKTKETIAALQTKKRETKDKYSFLRGLLVNSGEELKKNVIKVLVDIFKVEVTDADKDKDGDLAEDILIRYNGSIILAEIKGVSDKNPTPRFITQIWKHIHHSEHKSVANGALVLNYDIKTDPAERPLAYKGEYEKELEDIIFIDTRVLFELAVAIIDWALSPEEAKKMLFNKGRVSFKLDSYIESKKHAAGGTYSKNEEYF